MFNRMHRTIQIKGIIALLILFLSVVIVYGIEGCCESFCKTTEYDKCPGNFNPSIACENIDDCNIGCCIDDENYCLSNYIKSNCDREGFKFVKKECDQLAECTTEILPIDLVGYTGYPVFYKRDVVTGYSVIDPYFVRPGDEVVIGLNIYSLNDLVKVEAKISYLDNIFGIIILYDDGNSRDRNRGDVFFANTWTIPDNVNLDIYKLGVNYILHYKNGTVEEVDSTFNITVSRIPCMPIDKVKENAEVNLVIMKSPSYSASESDYKKQVLYHASKIMRQNLFLDNYEKINFYRVDNQYDFTDLNNARNIISNECSSVFDPNKDFILILDPSNENCTDGNYVIDVNPIAIYFDLGNQFDTLVEGFQNLCSYMMTEKQLDYLKQEQSKPPAPYILTPPNTVFSTPNPTVDFIIKDNADENISYEIYVFKDYDYSDLSRISGIPEDYIRGMADGEFMNFLENYNIEKNEVMVEGVVENNVVSSDYFTNLGVGTYDLWMYAIDSNDNINGTEPIEIRIVDSTTDLNPIITYDITTDTNSFLLIYRIEYPGNDIVDYSIYVDSSLLEFGQILSNTDNSKLVSLSDGSHSITLEAEYGDETVSSEAIVIDVNPPSYPSPKSVGYDGKILISLIIVLAFFIGIAIISYYEK